MPGSQIIVILVLASIAGLILFRLYTVLGRKTGNERRPQQNLPTFGAQEAQPKETAGPLLEDRTDKPDDMKDQPEQVRSALIEIKLADKSFETDRFLAGAKRAYEEIVVAFAKGDKESLRPLLADDVYAAFSGVIDHREKRQEKVEFTFVGFGDVRITEASLINSMANITVSFASQFISATSDSTGAVTEGDPKSVRSATDIWTFERDVRSADPNWRLVATSGEADLQIS